MTGFCVIQFGGFRKFLWPSWLQNFLTFSGGKDLENHFSNRDNKNNNNNSNIRGAATLMPLHM